jgi:hypothetical protein
LAKKIKKSELLEKLYEILDDRHWDLFSQLVGRELNRTPTSRINFLSKIFKRTIVVSSRKGKGRELQKWTCEQISNLTGIPWGNEDDCEIKSRTMGSSGTDVIMSSRVRKLFPLSIECKNQETWKPDSYIAQAKNNCYPETDWLVIMTKNGQVPVAMLDAKTLFKLLDKNK